MAVLIAGAGLIGCQAAHILVERGETPVLFDISPQMDNIARILDPAKVRLIRGDVWEPLDLMKVIQEQGIDRITHSATLFGLTAGKTNLKGGTVRISEVAEVCGYQTLMCVQGISKRFKTSLKEEAAWPT